MLILADYIHDLENTRFRRHAAFIAAAGLGNQYCVAPREIGCDGAPLIVGLYDDTWFHQEPYATKLSLPADGEKQILSTTLNYSMRLISFLADQPEWLARLRTTDPDAADGAIVAAFDIDAAQCRSAVKSWDTGLFLAPHEGGYAHFFVDTHGELTIKSWSPKVLAVALHLAASREGDRVRLSDRVGKMTPIALD